MIEDLELNEIIALGPEVEPISIEDNDPDAISPIMYPKNYSCAMSYLRAIMTISEYSLRALRLTAYIISLNPAHYTIWTYRADCLFALDVDLEVELRYLEEMAGESSKNYQIWHHREVIVEKMGKLPEHERDFLAHMLDEDAKNYHVWCYRLWLCKTFTEMALDELDYTEMLIRRDVYNNSAWNHRYFVLFELKPDRLSRDIDDEISFVKEIIMLADENQAAWAYLQAIYKASSRSMQDILSFVSGIDSMPAQNLYATILCQRAQKGYISEVLAIYKKLETDDPIRCRYWQYKASTIAASDQALVAD